jgi:hypothetical protein
MIYRKRSELYPEGLHLGFGNIDWSKLVASVIICQLAGLLGAIFTSPAIPAWYATLEKPSFVPPDWTFSVVWTFLYLLMGMSLYLVWRKGRDRRDVRLAMGVFGLQLFLNFLVRVVLRPAFASAWSDRDRIPVACHCRDDLALLPYIKTSRTVAYTLPCVGIFCGIAELLYMAAQSLKELLYYKLTLLMHHAF